MKKVLLLSAIFLFYSCILFSPYEEDSEPRPEITQPFNMGLYLSWTETQEDFDFAVATGEDLNTKWSRTEFIWFYNDHYDLTGPFDDIQELIDGARGRGINLYGLIAGDDNSNAPTTEEEFQDYSDYAAGLVERYGDDIKYWEIWNEVNAQDHWPPNGNRPEDYFRLLQLTYTKIKQVDPTAQVIGFGGIDPRDEDYLETFCSLGGLEYMDILSVHPYADDLPWEDGKRDLFETTGMLTNFDNLHRIMKEYDRVLPIWGTEMYISTGGIDGVSEQRQAELIVRMNLLMHAQGVEQLSWFLFWDEGDSGGGVVRPDKTPKLSYGALQTIATLFEGCGFPEKLEGGDENILLKYTKEDGTVIVAAWTYSFNEFVESGDNLTVPREEAVKEIAFDQAASINKVLDIYGQELPLQEYISGANVKISSSPLFLFY